MATKNIVPRANGEGKLGTGGSNGKGWLEGHFTDVTTGSANQGGKIVLASNDGAPTGDSHRLGVIEFKGAEDSSGTLVNAARIEALTEAAWTNVENGGALFFWTTDGDASESLVAKFDSNKKTTLYGVLELNADASNYARFTCSATGDLTVETVGSGTTDSDMTFTADGKITMTPANISGTVFHLDANAATGNIVDIDAGTLDIDASGSVSIDTPGVISIDSNNDSNYTVTGSGTSLTLNAVGGGSAQQAIVESAGTGAAACAITASAGGITLDAETDIVIDANGGDITFKDDGTSLAAVDANGQLTAKNYRTIWIGAGAMSPAGTNGAQAGTDSWTSTSSYLTQDKYLFDASTDEYVFFNMVMPEQWDLGTMKVKFYWKASSNASGNVIWGIQSNARSNDDKIDVALGTAVTVTDAAHQEIDANQPVQISDATGAMTVGNSPAADDMIYFAVYRDANAGGDTFNADAELLGVSIQYREHLTVEAAW